ncbi:MAG: hypothetical protein KTR14_00060 [Vampirovibrio sp.]|nr:hypothetical protein [Vampirovibrio sp.]
MDIQPAANTSLETSPAFGATVGASTVPFSVIFQNNQLLNREFIDVFGLQVTSQFAIRNHYERLEKFLHSCLWWGLGLTAPILLERLISRRFSNNLRRDPKHRHLFKDPESIPKPAYQGAWYQKLAQYIGNLGKDSILRFPFEWFDPSKSDATKTNPSHFNRLAEDLGFKDTHALKTFLANKAVKSRILKGKFGIMTLDLLAMMSVGQLQAWAKNAMTEKLSGRQGFSGEFTYTSDAYLTDTNQNYQAEKGKRFWQGMAAGFLGGVVAIPAVLWTGLKAKQSKGLARVVKNVIPHFNYHNGIFMSRWLILASAIFNGIIPQLMAARDGQEKREMLINTGAIFFFFMVGDSLYSGLRANHLQKKVDKLFPDLKAKLVQRGVWGLPAQTPLREIVDSVGKDHLLYKMARRNYWSGLVATCLGVGLVLPLLNYRFTKHKVMQDQSVWLAKRAGHHYEPLKRYRLLPDMRHFVPSTM